MSAWRLTRRTLLKLGAVLGLAATGCIFPRGPAGEGVVVFRRSGRRKHVSNAAKKHNANRLYATAQAAANDAPHPGDCSQVVEVVISANLAASLFPDGKQVADLRRDL